MSKRVVYIKSEEEIELMRAAARLLAQTHGEIAKLVKEGATSRQLDVRAEEYIRDHGGIPAFKGQPGPTPFPYTLCLSRNEVVVHGFADDQPLRSGEVLSVDCGVCLGGYYADSAYTYAIGEVPALVRALLHETQLALQAGIAQAVAGNRIGDIGYAVQQQVAPKGLGVVRELVGHGIGKNLHEAPDVPNYGKRGSGLLLQEGMVLAIEPMITLGRKDVVQENDGWTIRTLDRKPAAHFEHTVVVRPGQAEVLTSFAYIEEVLGINQPSGAAQ